MYGIKYACNHPLYSFCTLFKIGDRGIAVIQQRFDPDTKTTWWSDIDTELQDEIYLNINSKITLTNLERFKMRKVSILQLQYDKLCGR